jgi:hypothetical protein
MTTSHTAQGLASLGRYGDSMLVHMSPHEVAGLNYLAKKQGTKLTINPDTGLPEAFSLGGFFSSLLPMFAGMAFAPATGGFSMAPLLAGAATGAVMAGAQGKDPLMGGLMGGLGGYGGGQLGPALGAATPGGYVAGQAVKGAANPLMDTAVNTTLSGAGSSMMTNPLITNAANSMTQAGLGAGSGVGFMDKATQNVMDAGSGLKNIATGQPGAYDAFKAAGGTPMQLAMPVGGALLSGLEPSDIYGEPINMDEAKKKQAYDPYATLNLSGDTGLRLYATGGTIASGGLRDLYGTADSTNSPQLSRDGYGVGRLDSLAREQAMTQAQTTGYAMGGPVSFADGGDTNPITSEIAPIEDSMGIAALTPQPSTNQNMPVQQVQNAAMALSGAPDASTTGGSIIEQVANNLKADPNYQPKNPIEASIINQLKGTDPMQQGQPSLQGLGSLGPSQPMAPSFNPSQSMAPSFNPSVAMNPTYFAGINAPQGYADGGGVVAGEKGMNLDELPSLNLNTGTSSINSSGNGFGNSSEMTDEVSPLYRHLGLSMGKVSPLYRYLQLSVPSTHSSAGVHKGLLGMAQGGYLNGQGDGMSDSIPATIEGKQPARLADSEFVLPADVVSHIGNGSSKAGAKRLYKMMDKIRMARTGTKKQGKQINPDKYLPA